MLKIYMFNNDQQKNDSVMFLFSMLYEEMHWSGETAFQFADCIKTFRHWWEKVGKQSVFTIINYLIFIILIRLHKIVIRR